MRLTTDLASYRGGVGGEEEESSYCMLNRLVRHAYTIACTFYLTLMLNSLIGAVYLQSLRTPDCSIHVIAVVSLMLSLGAICVPLFDAFHSLLPQQKTGVRSQ